MTLRILFQNRGDMYENKGGDSVQLLKTKEYLERLGVSVDVSTSPDADLSDYDLVHLFNITRIEETYDNVIHAKRSGKRIVLSPIYWNIDEYMAAPKVLSLGRKALCCLKVLVPPVAGAKRASHEAAYREFRAKQAVVLGSADAILPNSEMEQSLLIQDFPDLRPSVFRVVPNGVDTDLLSTEVSNNVQFQDMKEYIVCVGRIEERKNQRRLIQALQGTTMPLIFVGKSADTGYTRACAREGQKRGNVVFAGEIEHGELGAIYAGARVHALPSWYETPGLVNLEAGLMKCNLAVSDRGSVREYFGDLAYYCDPLDIESIRSAVLEAYRAPRNNALSTLIRQKYSWQQIARATLQCYESLLSTGSPQP